MTDAARRLEALAARYELDDRARAALMALLATLAEDPTAPTSVREPISAVDVHLADSLVALELPEVRAAGAVADLGAGAGFPGLALAATLPEARVALVESVGRKCAFLVHAVEAAGLAARAEVACTRVETWSAGREAWPLVTARALAALPVLVEYAAPLLAPGGLLVAWKGRRDGEEEEAGAAAAAALGLELEAVRGVHPYRAATHRHLHVFRKVAPTPAGYPRRSGIAAKRPLGARRSDRSPG